MLTVGLRSSKTAEVEKGSLVNLCYTDSTWVCLDQELVSCDCRGEADGNHGGPQSDPEVPLQ